MTAAALLLLLMIPALSSCKSETPKLTYGDIYSAVAIRQPQDGSPAQQRGLHVNEAKEVFEYLYQAKLKEPDGELPSPIGSITVKLKKQAEGRERLYEYGLTTYDGYQTWELMITADGTSKVWQLEDPDGLDEIVKNIMEDGNIIEAGNWSPVESNTPSPIASAGPTDSAQ